MDYFITELKMCWETAKKRKCRLRFIIAAILLCCTIPLQFFSEGLICIGETMSAFEDTIAHMLGKFSGTQEVDR